MSLASLAGGFLGQRPPAELSRVLANLRCATQRDRARFPAPTSGAIWS